MTTSAFDRQNNPVNCFTPGTLQLRKKQDAGRRFVAHRKEETPTYRTVGKIKETCRKCENRMVDSPDGVTLNRLFLLQLHCVDEPCQLCSVDVSEQKLNSVKPDDFSAFENVVYIDASINSLSLASFSCFASLRELNLALNGICSMIFDSSDFPLLEVLDLSYNNLSADAVVSLGRLLRLKVLHLTGNELHHLPPNLGSSSHDPTQLPGAEGDERFEALEILMLDDNKLSSEVFYSLTNLKRLKYLNLQENQISEIPYMEMMDSLQSMQIPAEEQTEEEGSLEEDHEGSNVPLPELQFLNLANNKITTEEALIAASFFPSLRELDIHSNPLTTQKRGHYPLLAFYLRQRLGIKVKQQREQEFLKFPLKASADPTWKVEKNTPKVSKRPPLLNADCPTQTQTDKGTTRSKGKKRSTIKDDTRNFFITQAQDEKELEFPPPSEERKPAENKQKTRTRPEQSMCFDMVKDAKKNSGMSQPVEIQTAVRRLEHTLRNLNVYRDSKPKLDSIQTPYREREKKIKEMPPLRPVKQPAERAYEMIKDIKESRTIKIVALGSGIHGTGVNREECKEALSLLRDMKTKYMMVYEKTMERASSLETGKNTEQNVELPPVHVL